LSSEYAFEPLRAPLGVQPAASGPEALLDAARAEALAIRERAQAEGHAAGLAAGRAEAQAAATHALSALSAALEAIEADRAHAVDALECAAVELGLRIGERVLAGALAVEPERVVDVVRGALRTLLDRERVQLLVHPDDLELVAAATSELAAELGGIERLEVQAERRLARGGAIIRTLDGEVDATIEAKLQNVRTAVEAELAA
jgi:flagellar assembly protein FliH